MDKGTLFMRSMLMDRRGIEGKCEKYTIKKLRCIQWVVLLRYIFFFSVDVLSFNSIVLPSGENKQNK